jgi:hypothetical protein
MTEPHLGRRTLESLKKEAKRWLSALRKNHPESRLRFEQLLGRPPENPTLRDVQHALAIEHGFAGWADLRRALMVVEEQTAKAVGQFDAMADALLDAYRTGTREAMERHWSLTWHRRGHQAMRTHVQLDLGRQVGSTNWDDDITPEDARLLVAREHGFANWDALVNYYRKLRVAPSSVTHKPVRALASESDDDSSQCWHSRDWNAVLAHLRDRRPIGIDAAGQITDAMLEDLASLGHLQILRLGGSRGVSDAGMRHIARLPRLRHLDLSGTGITDSGLDALGDLPELETVSLAWTRVTDAGAMRLAGCEPGQRQPSRHGYGG